MSQKNYMPTLPELTEAIKALASETYAPSLSMFRAAYCNSDNPKRWVAPGFILRHFGYPENTDGWASMCCQLTGLIYAGRSYYMTKTYANKDPVTRTPQSDNPTECLPPPRKTFRFQALGYSFRSARFYRTTIVIR